MIEVRNNAVACNLDYFSRCIVAACWTATHIQSEVHSSLLFSLNLNRTVRRGIFFFRDLNVDTLCRKKFVLSWQSLAISMNLMWERKNRACKTGRKKETGTHWKSALQGGHETTTELWQGQGWQEQQKEPFFSMTIFLLNSKCKFPVEKNVRGFRGAEGDFGDFNIVHSVGDFFCTVKFNLR